MRDLVIYGAGGFAREVAELVDDINSSGGEWNLRGFLSDSSQDWGKVSPAGAVLGGRDWLHGNQGIAVAFGIGNPAAKAKVFRSVAGLGLSFPTLVHPKAVIGRRCVLGPGTIVTAGNILTTDIVVGALVAINLACTVGHDTRVEDFATIAPGANLSGSVRVGEGSDIGTGAAIIQGISVGSWSVVGAGAVVVRDLPDNCTAVGVPARVIVQREPGWHERP